MLPGLPSLLIAFLATAGTGRGDHVSDASLKPSSSDLGSCPYGPDINENFYCRAWQRAGKYQYLGMPLPGALHNIDELCEEESREFYSIRDKVRPTETRYNADPPSSTRCQSVIPDPYSSPTFQCDGLKRARRYQDIGISEPEAVEIVYALCKEEQGRHTVENAWRTRLGSRKHYVGFEPPLESQQATNAPVSFQRDIYPPFQCLALERVKGMPVVPEHLRDIDAVCREEHMKFLAEPGWHYTHPNYRCGAWERVRKYEQLGFPVSDAMRDIPAQCAEEWDEYSAIQKRLRQKAENLPIPPPFNTPYVDDSAKESRLLNGSTSHSPATSTVTPLSSSTPTPYRSLDEVHSECRRKFGIPPGQRPPSLKVIRQIIGCVHEAVFASPELVSYNNKYGGRRRRARPNEKKIDERASTVTPSSTYSSSAPAPTPSDDQGTHRTYSSHVSSCLAKLAVNYREPIPPDVLLKVSHCLEKSQQADEDRKETNEEAISVALSPSPTATSPPDANITGKPTTPEPGHKTHPAPLTIY